jgi:hypothetical protein
VRVFSIYAAVLVALTIGAWELVFDGGARSFKTAPAGTRAAGETSLTAQVAKAQMPGLPRAR